MTVLLLASLPLENLCQLITVNQTTLQIQLTTLPDAHVSFSAKAVLLGSLLLQQIVCRLIATSDPGINKNDTLVEGQRPTQNPPVILPDGYVAFPEDHAAYKIHQEFLLWDQAHNRCISEGARLAVTDTFDKITHVTSLRNLTFADVLQVGIHKSIDTNEWVRVDNGFQITSLPWNKLLPNGGNGCVYVIVGYEGLFDYDCDDGVRFVCEISI